MPGAPARMTVCEEGSEDTAFLIGAKRDSLEPERPAPTHLWLRRFFYFQFIASIANFFYDCLLYLRLTRSPTFDAFRHVCHPAVTTALFLDLSLSAATLLLALYALRLLRDRELCVRMQLEEVHTYFAGYTAFWVGVKSVMALFVTQHDACVFSNLNELGVGWLPAYRAAALAGCYAVQAAALLWSWHALAEAVLARKRRVAEILLYD